VHNLQLFFLTLHHLFNGPRSNYLIYSRRFFATIFYLMGGPKRNRKRSLVGGSVVVYASAAICLLRGPFCISLQTDSFEWSGGAT
jgi:hypothetical protein